MTIKKTASRRSLRSRLLAAAVVVTAAAAVVAVADAAAAAGIAVTAEEEQQDNGDDDPAAAAATEARVLIAHITETSYENSALHQQVSFHSMWLPGIGAAAGEKITVPDG